LIAASVANCDPDVVYVKSINAAFVTSDNVVVKVPPYMNGRTRQEEPTTGQILQMNEENIRWVPS
jgi:hypothetical protein